MSKEVHVSRTYLVRRFQQYTLEIPDDLDPKAWLEADPAAFDEAVCSDGTLRSEDDQMIDDDELTVMIDDDEPEGQG